jgi:DNA-binding response OmpR family regulator
MVTKVGKKKILIVDDEPDLNNLFQLALEYAGFGVQTYEDPVIALSHFEPGLFDLVVLDIKMPKMDGFELYKELKKKDSNVKICFLTASEMYYEENRKKEYDSIDKDLFIRKPVSTKELVERLNKIIADKE